MMAQYKEIKAKYPDAILFFRLGDFYEMFFEDAVEVSKILQLTLTSRNKGDHKAPMCGIPYHAASNYISKLTRIGKKVAICEQLSDPNLPGIVKRDVIRVITPGTTLDDNILEQKSNNYLVAISIGQGNFGLASADISTGEFRVTELADKKALQTELERVRPTECIVEAGSCDSGHIPIFRESDFQCFFFEHPFSHDPTSYLLQHFGIQSLDGFGMAKMTAGINAAALLLDYLKHTQKTELSHIGNIKPYEVSEFMPLDDATLKNLELLSTLRENKREGSLLWVLDETLTSMGGRLLRFILTHPLTDANEIRQRLDAVEEFAEHTAALYDIRESLQHIPDLERLLARLSLGYGNARDLIGLKNALQAVPVIRNFLEPFSSVLLINIRKKLDDLPHLVDLIGKAIADEPPLAVKEGGMIRDGYNGQLDEIKTVSREGKGFIQSMQQKEKDRTGIQSLKIRYNQVFGYYIEVSKANLHAVPDDYIRKQTLVNAERYITPELKEYEEKVLGAEEKIIALEYKIFNEVRQKVVEEIGRIQSLAHAIAELDVEGSLAIVAKKNNYCKPIIHDGFGMNIRGGRHPVVEKMTFSSSFIPNDIGFDDKTQMVLITGPNMGGKSTYLRQSALIVLMAHIGSFVPADTAEIGLVDRIFTRVGASDNLVRGQSTFMVEMQETAFILNNATSKSFIILDEIGRGTSTYDGMSIAWAIMEFIHDNIRAKTLFATHYHELISLASKLPYARNASFAIRENEKEGVVFLYKIVDGGVDRSYGIEVAKLAGLPAEVTNKAKQILVDLEEGVLEAGIEKELSDARKRTSDDQLALFERMQRKINEHPAVDEIKQLDMDQMTPLEALNKLASIKKKLS